MSEPLYVWIPSWDRFQHYKDRNPPWIKNYLELLHDEDYLALTETQRATLHGTWIAYAAARRKLVGSTSSLSRKLSLRVTKRTLDALVAAGFIELIASATLAERLQGASGVQASRAPARSQEAEAEEPLPNGQRGSSTRSSETAPPRAAKRAATANGSNLTQNGHVADQALAAYDSAARWLRSGGAFETDWRYRLEMDFGVTDDIELAGLADLQKQLATAEVEA